VVALLDVITRRPHTWGMVMCRSLILCVFSLGLLATTALAEDPPAFLLKWGSFGNQGGQFAYPAGIAVHGNNNYVADFYNYHIEKFDNDGAFLLQWTASPDPFGVAVDPQGYVYVGESSRVQKFNDSGQLVLTWGSFGTNDGQFTTPGGIALDGSGNVYVTDFVLNRVQKFDATGTFLLKWGTTGSSDGQFKAPLGIAIDGSGNVYVADTGNDRIQKFDDSGTLLTQWGSLGTGDGQFDLSESFVAVDAGGNVYVTDSDNDRIQKFDGNGTFLTKWGSRGTGDGQFQTPKGIAVDATGNVYIADSGNYRVQKFGGQVAVQSMLWGDIKGLYR
jgi:tripartite motif-containing protein 71